MTEHTPRHPPGQAHTTARGIPVPDSQAHWRVLAARTRTGPTRGEKVLVVLDPADTGGTADEILRNTAVYVPDGSFSTGADLAWGRRTDVIDDQLLDYEACMEPLFVDPRLTTMCWYSRHQDTDHMVAATRTVHPLQVMTHLDALEVIRTDGSSPLRYALDLTDLLYMEAHTAWQLLGFARGLPDGDTLDIRCGPIPEAVLRGLGSDDVRQLRIRTETVADVYVDDEPEGGTVTTPGSVSGTGR